MLHHPVQPAMGKGSRWKGIGRLVHGSGRNGFFCDCYAGQRFCHGA